MSKREGRTEAPTEKKRKDARKKGTVSKSQDLGPWITLLIATYLIPATVGATSSSAIRSLASLKSIAAQPDSQKVVDLLGQAMFGGLMAIMPFLGVCALVGVVTHVGQTGLVLSLHPLKPDFKRVNPIEGAKRLFSAKSIWETGKQVAKSLLIGWLCWPHINGVAANLTNRGRVPLMEGLSESARALMAMTRATCYAIIVVAMIDFMYQRRSRLLDLKMTKQEIRDEMRSSEGDPHMKQRIRSLQMAMSRSRMMADVPSANVIITNPTHVAIALRYDPTVGGAPRVVAAGIDAIALRIREKARESGVPIVEAKPLARALWRSCEVGDEIPAQLYEAVAKVLAFVRRLRGGILSASVLPLPRLYHVDDRMLESVTGRRPKRQPAA
jgi:flagellar biosynthetic protein FlhB